MGIGGHVGGQANGDKETCRQGPPCAVVSLPQPLPAASSLLHPSAPHPPMAESTFGKGKIQSVFELEDQSAIVVTVARYTTPAGAEIDQVCRCVVGLGWGLLSAGLGCVGVFGGRWGWQRRLPDNQLVELPWSAA